MGVNAAPRGEVQRRTCDLSASTVGGSLWDRCSLTACQQAGTSVVMTFPRQRVPTCREEGGAVLCALPVALEPGPGDQKGPGRLSPQAAAQQ